MATNNKFETGGKPVKILTNYNKSQEWIKKTSLRQKASESEAAKNNTPHVKYNRGSKDVHNSARRSVHTRNGAQDYMNTAATASQTKVNYLTDSKKQWNNLLNRASTASKNSLSKSKISMFCEY